MLRYRFVFILGTLVGVGCFGYHLLVAASQAAGDELFPKDGPRIPKGLVPIVWPDDNEYTAEKAELGYLLFFDKRLSCDGTVSCASCHSPKHGFSNGDTVATGVRNLKGGRNSPTVINRAYSGAQFWDGRARTLEEQAKGPIANPIEMDLSHESLCKNLNGIRGYRDRFKQVFGKDRIEIDDIAKALATFERTVLSGNSPYDRFKGGEQSALTASQQAGMKIFFSNKARCDTCHEGVNFSNSMYTNIGVGMDKKEPDLGRFNVTKKEEDKGAFKTPTLRDLLDTAPYMHDGSMKTLEEVVEHYSKGGIKNKWLHQDIKPLDFTPEEKKNLVDFLKALQGTGGWRNIREPSEFPK